MNVIKLKLIGTKPLLMHSDRYADPLNIMTKMHKSLTSKRKKTDDDYETIAKSEWRGGLYFDEKIGPYLPATNVEGSLFSGGKLSKLGQALKRSVEIVEERIPLEYDGPRAVDQLWDKGFYDVRSVKVGGSRLMRYRPMFSGWSITFTLAYDAEAIDKRDIVQSFEKAGQYCGIGDYRPEKGGKFGRYTVEEIK